MLPIGRIPESRFAALTRQRARHDTPGLQRHRRGLPHGPQATDAQRHLAELEKICGKSCEESRDLAKSIADDKTRN